MCDLNAECNNTVSSYTCSCMVGYEGNGTVCEGIAICVTLRGWIKNAVTHFVSYEVRASRTVYTNRILLPKNTQMAFHGDTNYINHA